MSRPTKRTTTTVIEEPLPSDGAGGENENPEPTSETEAPVPPVEPTTETAPTTVPEAPATLLSPAPGTATPPSAPETVPGPVKPPSTSPIDKLTEEAIRASLVTNNPNLHTEVKALLKDTPITELGDRLKDPVLNKLNDLLNASAVVNTSPRPPVIGSGGTAIPQPVIGAPPTDPKPKTFETLTLADYNLLSSVFK